MNPYHDFKRLRRGSGGAKAVAREQADFLERLWQPKHRVTAFGCVSFRRAGSSRFEDHFISAMEKGDLTDLLVEYERNKYDQYFCPNTFSRPRRLAKYVRETRLAWCDIDEADPTKFRPKPSFLWRTSPGRTQGLWMWNQKYPPHRAEQYSRSLAYSFAGDRGGWSANKLLRLPGSINHKPTYDKPKVRLLSADFTPIASKPIIDELSVNRVSVMSADTEIDPFEHDPEQVLRKLKRKLDPIVRSLSRDKSVRMRDRSKQIYVMIAGLHRAGATPNEIASVIWNSAYFQSKYGKSLVALQAEISRILSKQEAST